MGKGNANLTIVVAWLIVALFSTGEAQIKILDGEWRTTLGSVSLSSAGSRVSGVYQHGGNKGEINGRYSWRSRLVSGQWKLEGNSGRFLFKVFADGSGFLGEWWSGDSLRGGDWIGVRGEKDFRKINASASHFAGQWVSNYGLMTVDIEGLTASGEFSGIQNQGSFKGQIIEETNRLVAQWRDEKHSGKVIWHLIKGSSAIIGEWWYSDNEYGGFWYATRPVNLDGCVSGDCLEETSTYVWADGSRYEGQWLNGLFHGKGNTYDPYGKVLLTGIWADGVYIGKCESGECLEGNGKVAYRDGSVYDGHLANGFPEGEGMTTTSNNAIYRGTFKNGLPNGDGRLEWSDGAEKYTGLFGLGKMQGKGLYQFADGGKYDGLFRRGKRFGKGIMVWPNGDWYEGEWHNDHMEGHGTYVFKSGDRYIGLFKQSQRSGKGSYKFADGETLETTWSEDLPKTQTVDTNSYDGMSKPSNEPVRETKATLPPRPSRSLKNENTYLVYEVIPSANPPYYREGEQENRLVYFFVTSPRSLSRTQVRDVVEANSDFVLVSGHRVEKTEEPLLRLQKIYRRYSGGLNKTRLFLSEGGIINLNDEAADNIVESEPLSN